MSCWASHWYCHGGATFAERLGVTPISVPGTHEGLLSHPDEIAKAILAAS